MLCENCKQEIKEDEKYCQNCGTFIKRTPSFNSVEIMKAEAFSNSVSKIPINNKSDLRLHRDKKNRKKRLTLATLLIVVGIISIVSGLLLNKNKVFYDKTGKRTFMIYMIGSDLESKYLAATKDINEIIDSNVDFEDNNIIIYAGGAKEWHIDEISNDKHTLFEINSNGIKKIEEFDNRNDMLDYNNLKYLLEYAKENYDTEYYDLILWDHGAGPINGYGYDEYNKTKTMSINDIKKALDESPFNGEQKLELLGFDACLMSSIEIANILEDNAQYMIASEEFEPSRGLDYSFLKEINKTTNSVDLGKTIVDYFDSYYKSNNYTKGYSLSLLKLSKMENVIENADTLFKKIDSNLDIEYSNLSRTRSNSKTFGRLGDNNYYYDLVDFNDLLDNLEDKYSKEVTNLKSSINDLVIYQKTDLENTNGISIYFPYENKKDFDNNYKIYKNINFSNEYNTFIQNFIKTLNGERINVWDLTTNNLEYNDNEISILLSEDVLKNYSSAEYVIFKKDGNNFTPVFNGSDISQTQNNLKTTIEKKSIIVKDKEDSMYVNVIESVRGKDYVKYLIPITATKIDDNFEYDIVGAYLEFIVDSENPNGYIGKAYPADLNENLTYSKVEMDLSLYDSISFLSYSYNILDEFGNYTKDWINSNIVNTLSVDDLEEVEISFEDLDIANNFYALFKIKDSQGYSYYSNLIKIDK